MPRRAVLSAARSALLGSRFKEAPALVGGSPGGHHVRMLSHASPPALSELRHRRDEIIAVTSRHGAVNVRIFGSVARGEERVDSDLDLLVDLEPGRSLFDLAALHLDLEDLLGCRVDIATMLKPRMRHRIETEALGL